MKRDEQLHSGLLGKGGFAEQAKNHKAKSGETITFDSLSVPNGCPVPTTRKKNENGEPIPPKNSNGEPKSAAQLVLESLMSRYRPGIKSNGEPNPLGNPKIFGQVQTFYNKIRIASGLNAQRGREGYEAADEATTNAVAAMLSDI